MFASMSNDEKGEPVREELGEGCLLVEEGGLVHTRSLRSSILEERRLSREGEDEGWPRLSSSSPAFRCSIAPESSFLFPFQNSI